MDLPPYVILDKSVGQTPLACLEEWRRAAGVAVSVPLTYAGRLDPMASGKLLILIGEECKQKDSYLNLDKVYNFSALLGIESDTHDVLGRLRWEEGGMRTGGNGRGAGLTSSNPRPAPTTLSAALTDITQKLTGKITLPYPHFSSKTVAGKPLHQWSLEGRLHEINIPSKTSTIYQLTLTDITTDTRANFTTKALTKINTIPPVTTASKQLGDDFRRTDIRADWEKFGDDNTLPTHYTIACFQCVCSSGTYMRTLARMIGQQLSPATPALAWSIHRTALGQCDEQELEVLGSVE